MTALCCVDTETRRLRRYILQVHAGMRRAVGTHEYNIIAPQEDTLVEEINRLRMKTLPGMDEPITPEAA